MNARRSRHVNKCLQLLLKSFQTQRCGYRIDIPGYICILCLFSMYFVCIGVGQ